MAIKIRKKVEEEVVIKANDPEVLPPEGSTEAVAEEVKIPGLDDKFLATSGSALQWIMDHRRMVIFVSCVIVAAAFVWIGVNHAIEAQNINKSQVLTSPFITYTALTHEEAQQLEAARRQYLAQQGIAADTTDVLKSNYSVPDDKTRFSSIAHYLSIELPSLASEDIGISGQLMLAGSQARLDKMNDAKNAYDKAATSKVGDVALFAQLGQVEVLVNAKQFDDAIAVLDKIMAKNPGLSAYATLEKGRIYEMANQIEKAIAAYAQVNREFGQENDKAMATSRLKYLTKDWESYARPAAPIQNPNPQAAL